MILSASRINSIKESFRRHIGPSQSSLRPQIPGHTHTHTYYGQRSGFVKALDGYVYKVSFMLDAQGVVSDVKVEKIMTYDEHLRSYREKPECLTMNEMDLLFPLLAFEDALPNLQTPKTHFYAGQTTAENDFSCAVCLADMAAKQTVRVLSCNHVFHDECIVTWILQNHGNCPLCKRDFRREAAAAVANSKSRSPSLPTTPAISSPR